MLKQIAEIEDGSEAEQYELFQLSEVGFEVLAGGLLAPSESADFRDSFVSAIFLLV